ncbi:hypothetical protein [Shewanella sp.]|uniref:hypothetical protein n=1 Tax=Shewanella sp. TaxID=50422 RepID=UPI001ED77F85|nr:hypothetical protein [Shewanella sp.]NRB25921.1 hypothetical protein [Shewanella sp.]
MGLLSSVGSFVSRGISVVSSFLSGGSNSSGNSDSSHRSSSSSTSYDPDKVKIAEIDKETQLQLAGKEQERIKLMRDVKIEILREQARFEEAITQTKLDGLQQMSDIIVSMQARFNDVAEKRLRIIEQGSMNIIKDIENFYYELQKSIEERDIEFTENKLPKLLEQLGKYPEDSAPYQLYFKKIESLIVNQSAYSERALEDLSARQDKIITSSLATKERITAHTDQLTSQIVEKIMDKSDMLQKSLESSLPEYREQLAEIETPKLIVSKHS